MKRLFPGFFMAAVVFSGCHSLPVIHAQRKEMVETVYASGKIVSDDEFNLAALCNGRITRKLVHDGDTVKKGQVLFEISADDVRDRTDAAAANYAISEGNLSARSPRLSDLALAFGNAQIKLQNDSLTYVRWERLWAENIGTKNNLDNCWLAYQLSTNNKRIAEQQYLAALDDLAITRNNARAQLTTAQKELGDYSIRSDRDGIVYQTFKEAGEAVRLNETVALLGNRRRPVIRLAVDQQDIGRIATGQPVLVQADATGSRIYPATVTRVYPVMNELDQTFRADAAFSEGVVLTYIHSSVEANIIIRRKPATLVLPRSALAARDSVLAITGGRRSDTRMIHIVTGMTTLDDIEVLSGIDEKTAIQLPVQTFQP